MNSNPANLKEVQNLKQKFIVFCVARVPQTEKLYVGSSDFKVYEIDLAAEKPEPVPFSGEGHESYVTGVALAGNLLVSGGYDGRVIWWETETRKPIRVVDAHEKWIRRVVASPDGSLVATVADDMLCKLWNAKTGELVREVTDHQTLTPNNYPSMLYAMTFSSDGKLMATGDKVGHVAVWETDTGKKIGEVEAPILYTWDPKQRRHSIGGIRSLAFSADSKLLAVGGIGTIGNIDHLGGPARIEVFDWKAGKRLHEISDEKLKGLNQQINFHPSGDWIVATGGDHKGFVSFWEMK
ncbi:MAG: hypothetical protein IID46_05155, partial [Planctomycetes bacterium]|nr:hypothetical protein [Planctomycetota bacterium]